MGQNVAGAGKRAPIGNVRRAGFGKFCSVSCGGLWHRFGKSVSAPWTPWTPTKLNLRKGVRRRLLTSGLGRKLVQEISGGNRWYGRACKVLNIARQANLHEPSRNASSRSARGGLISSRQQRESQQMRRRPLPKVCGYKSSSPATCAEARCNASFVRMKSGGACEKHRSNTLPNSRSTSSESGCKRSTPLATSEAMRR